MLAPRSISQLTSCCSDVWTGACTARATAYARVGTQIKELLEILASRAAHARARVVIVAVRLAEDVLVLLLHVRHLLVVWLSWDSERRESGPISPVDHTEDLPLILASIGNKRVPSGTLTMALHISP